jgi:hypothetical protein
MTRVEALNTAIEMITNTVELNGEGDPDEVKLTKTLEILTKIRDQISKPHTSSDEAKAKRSAMQKEKTAKARAELVSTVAPVLRKYLTSDVTAKELFEVAKGELPQDFSAAKVQNILIREMAPELVKTETKGHANTYRLVG